MPRTMKVANHPQREKIDRDIANGVSYRSIASQYGMSSGAVSRYVNLRVRDLLAKDKVARDTWSAERITEEYEALVARCKKLIEAAEVYLDDPDQPGRYTLEPHAHEIRVVYTRMVEGKPMRETKRLDQIMDQMREYQMLPVDERFIGGDPRRYLVEGLRELGNTLNRLASTYSTALEAEAHLRTSPVVEAFLQVLLSELVDHPELRENLANRVADIGFLHEVQDRLSETA